MRTRVKGYVKMERAQDTKGVREWLCSFERKRRNEPVLGETTLHNHKKFKRKSDTGKISPIRPLSANSDSSYGTMGKRPVSKKSNTRFETKHKNVETNFPVTMAMWVSEEHDLRCSEKFRR